MPAGKYLFYGEKMELKTLLKIDSVLEQPVLLAPMAGVTDYAFREICRRQGADMTYSEMISAKGLKYNSRRTFELADVHQGERLAIQLFGRDPKDIAQAIEMLQEQQGEKIVCFDLNMGCPAPKIVNNGEGSALMKEPLLAAHIVEEAKRTASRPVTVKFRKGFDMQHCNYLQFAQTMQEAGADAITVHGRLREQYYAGKADWACIAQIKKRVRIPVIANGDIFSPEDALAILQQTRADGIMVARGATGNPFLFEQIKQYLQDGTYKEVERDRKANVILQQAGLCCEAKGERRAMQEFRKHAAWYLKGVRGAAALRQQAISITSMEELKKLVDYVFGEPAHTVRDMV